jgi:hypothetical protein
MKLNNAWLGVILIALGLIAICVFTWLKIPQGATAIAIVTLGIGILQGIGHQNATQEVKTLRASMRPPPSLVDEFERLQSPSVSRETLLSVRAKPEKDPETKT